MEKDKLLDNFDFLVTGCNRGGTSLLGSMFSMHPELVVVNEHYECNTRILGDKKVGLKAPIPRMDLTRKKDYGFIQLYRKIGKYINSLLPNQIRGVYQLSIKDFLEADKPVFFIKRDSTENAKSIAKRTGMSLKKAEKEVQIASAIQKECLLKDTDTFKSINLQDLTQNPESIVESCCEMLEVSFQKKMLNGYKYLRSYKYSKLEQKT